jgi:hypothetical protein
MACSYKIGPCFDFIGLIASLQENATFQKANLTKMTTLTQGYVHFD